MICLSGNTLIGSRSTPLLRLPQLLLICFGITACSGAAHGQSQPQVQYGSASTLACLGSHGYAVRRATAEQWLRPRPSAKLVWAPLWRSIPQHVFLTGMDTVSLLFYKTSSEALAGARGWNQQSLDALCATFGPRKRWCVGHVHRRLNIPQFTDGNVFINFNGLDGASRRDQHRVAVELRVCRS